VNRLTGNGLLAVAVLLRAASPAASSRACVRLEKPGTRVNGDVKVCPGRYRIPDPREIGVIIVAGSGTRVDLTGVTLESGDSIPSTFVGVGLSSLGVDSVAIRGGFIRGYRFGIRLEGGVGHRVSGVNLSGSRSQALSSTASWFDVADWLDIFSIDSAEAYGAGLYLKRTRGVQVTGVIARGSQNGIGLRESREARLSDNDVSGNSGWGIHLWRSSQNLIAHNRADHSVRCEAPGYSRGCDSAALLLREESDSNLIVDNDLTWSGDGFFLSGQPPEVRPSIGNMVLRNDASHAYHNAFESTFSGWNSFLDNRADSSDYGFWLGYSQANVVRGNILLGSRSAAIAIEHGGENDLAANVIIGGGIGIRLFAPHPEDGPGRVYRVDDNTIAQVGRGIVVERTTGVRLRGNLLDGVGDGLIVDSLSRDVEGNGNVFLSASRWLVDAVDLDLGGNYWGGGDSTQVRRRIRGRVSIVPFRAAREAGY
jgi:parallel beta-helix repeat protein